MLLLLLLAPAFAQERPTTGSACVPLAYSDYLVVLTDRMVDTSDKFVDAMDGGYAPMEGARKTLVAVVANTKAQVSSLGDCQGETAYRDQVLRLVEFWDGMARGELATLSSFFLDGEITPDEATAAGTITSDLGTRGTVIEEAVGRAQASFAARFGFTIAGSTPAAPVPEPEPEPVYTPPPPAPDPEPYRPARVYHDPKLFVRLHGAADLDYAFDAGRRKDNYVVGADVNVDGGLRMGALYKHDVVGDREAERIHAIVRYSVPSKSSDKVFVGLGFFVDPGIAMINDEDITVGADLGVDTTLGVRIADRFSLGAFYRVDYELWFDDESLAAESFGTWEVQPGIEMTIGL